MTKFAVAALAAVLTFGGLSASTPVEARSFSAPVVRVSPMPRISTPAPRISTPKPVTVPRNRTQTNVTPPSTSTTPSTTSNPGLWAILGGLLMMEAVDEGTEAVVDNLMEDEEK